MMRLLSDLAMSYVLAILKIIRRKAQKQRAVQLLILNLPRICVISGYFHGCKAANDQSCG